jgi:hypothetical protein
VWSDVKDEIEPDADTMVCSVETAHAMAYGASENDGNGMAYGAAEIEGNSMAYEAAENDENALVLEAGVDTVSLASLHPPPYVMNRLKDIFIDRVDPLTRILHVPTFWKTLTDAVKNPQAIPKALQALIFAVYFTTASSLEEDECQSLFGEKSRVLISKYKSATHRALINARFLETSSLVVLQAFEFYLVSISAID